MAIQLPSRKAPQGRRQYAQPITRKNIKRVPNAADPGARGGPNAAATPGAFGGGAGLETAGNQLTALGEKWAKEYAQEQAQRNALLLGEVTEYVDFMLGQMASNLKTSQKGSLPKLNLPNANTGGGHQGLLTDDGSIPPEDMGHWKQNTGE
jgi:hypothetical protein